MTNETNGETFALETRVEELTYLSGDRRVRRGESDRLEVGSGPAQDIVSGTEHTRIGGHLSEHTGGNLSAQASRMETTVEGKLTQHFKSNTTLLGGAMTEVYTGGVFIGAGMSDDLVIGGGVRVTAPADLWLCGLIGMEEKIGSACADGALLELYRLAFEREYATGVHAAGAAVFSGTVHATMATGFRQLFKVSRGVRDLTPGGNAEGGDAPAPPAAPAPAPAPGGEAASGGMLMAQGATEMEDAEDLAALEDIRHLFGDLDTTVDSGRTGDRAALLEDLGSLAKYSETGEDVGDAGALANRLQEGAGLSDVVDAEDLRAMLGLDESPETLDETRLVPDEVVDSQVLDDDGNWVERVCIDPVEPEVRYEHPLGMDRVPEGMDIGQRRAAPGIPEDFDFERARTDFNWRLETKFRPDATLDTSETKLARAKVDDMILTRAEDLPPEWIGGLGPSVIPGTSEMEAARDYVDDLILTRASSLDPEWIGDLGLSADEFKRFSNDPVTAYRTMTEMADNARASDDIAKADFLRGVLDNIDVQSYSAYQKATENAEALRDAALNSRFPETVNLTAVLQDELEYELVRAQNEIDELHYGGVDMSDPVAKEQLDVLDQKVNLYRSMTDAIEAGRDPVLYLDEYVRLAADASDVSQAQFAAIIETQAELMRMFSDRELGFPLEVGSFRSSLGVEDFDMPGAMTDMAARIDEYAVDSTPGTTVLRDAFDRVNERALAQLEALPEEMLARAGLTDDSGELSSAIRRQIADDPGSAYRILTEMEADVRAHAGLLTGQQPGLNLLDEGAKKEDLEMADYLATVIARLDHDAKSEFERAVEEAEKLRRADNIPLANDVDQPAIVRAIQQRLDALHARRATLDPNDAKALAQLEAEQAFLNVALRRVEEGYDPRLRLYEIVQIEQDRIIRQGGDVPVLENPELANIQAAYLNVLDLLDDYPIRVRDMPSIDDVRLSGTGASTPTGYPGEELTDDDDLSRYYLLSPLGSSSDTESTVVFTDTEDTVYFETPSDDVRRRLDIDLHQLSLEDTSGIDESDLPPPKQPR